MLTYVTAKIEAGRGVLTAKISVQNLVQEHLRITVDPI